MVPVSVSSDCWTKNYRLDGLNNKHLFFTILEARKSKIKVLPYSDTFLLPLYGREQAQAPVFLSIKALIPLMRALPSWCNCLSKVLPPLKGHPITWEVRASTYEFVCGGRETQTFQFLTATNTSLFSITLTILANVTM